MGTFEQHCEDSRKRFGDRWDKVHHWMDEFHGVFEGKHRFMRHHEDGIEEVRQLMGDEAAVVARRHIELDCGGKVPKSKECYDKNYKGKDRVDWLGYGDDAYKVVDKRSGLVVPDFADKGENL